MSVGGFYFVVFFGLLFFGVLFGIGVCVGVGRLVCRFGGECCCFGVFSYVG